MLYQCPEDPNIDIHFYQIRFPTDRHGSSVKVNAAKLRLYIKGEPENYQGYEMGKIRITASLLKLKNHGWKLADQVMLDSDMFEVSTPGWVSLDVFSAVEYWHKHPRRPMGIMIRVEDDRGNNISAKSVLQSVNCVNGILFK